MPHYNRETNLVTARTPPTTTCSRRGQTSSRSSLTRPLRSFALTTSTLGGGEHHPRERDCGRKGAVAIYTLHHGDEGGTRMQAVPLRGRLLPARL